MRTGYLLNLLSDSYQSIVADIEFEKLLNFSSLLFMRVKSEFLKCMNCSRKFDSFDKITSLCLLRSAINYVKRQLSSDVLKDFAFLFLEELYVTFESGLRL